VLAVLSGPGGAPPGARQLLVRLAQWCDVRPASTHRRRATAWFATEPGAPGVTEPVEAGHPLGVWVERPDQLDQARTLGGAGAGRTFVTADPAVADGLAGEHVLVVGPGASGPPPPLPRSPFVRRRWRHRSGFPGAMVVRVGADVDDSLVPTALSLCAAAVVDHPDALRTALAAGAPSVTDAATAAAVGAVDGVHVVVTDGPTEQALGEARALAGDERRAAALGRAAADLFAERHHPDAAVRHLATRLGLPVAGDDPHGRALARVEALHTPPHARPAERLRQALEALPATVDRP
jgi:hypothetical protein